MARVDMAMLIQEIPTCLLISIDLKNDILLNNEFQNNESDFLFGSSGVPWLIRLPQTGSKYNLNHINYSVYISFKNSSQPGRLSQGS